MRKAGKTVDHSVLPSDMSRITQPLTKVNSMTNIILSHFLTAGMYQKEKWGNYPKIKMCMNKKTSNPMTALFDRPQVKHRVPYQLSLFENVLAEIYRQQHGDAIKRGIAMKKAANENSYGRQK